MLISNPSVDSQKQDLLLFRLRWNYFDSWTFYCIDLFATKAFIFKTSIFFMDLVHLKTFFVPIKKWIHKMWPPFLNRIAFRHTLLAHVIHSKYFYFLSIVFEMFKLSSNHFCLVSSCRTIFIFSTIDQVVITFFVPVRATKYIWITLFLPRPLFYILTFLQ